MAELALYSVAEHIESLIKEESGNILGVETEAKAVQWELESIKEYLVETQQMKEVVNKEEFRSLLTKAKNMAYEAEDVVDNYVSETESSHGILTYFPARKTSKELQRLRLEIKELKRELKKEGGERRGGTSRNSDLLKGHPQADQEYMVGIENDVTELVNMLTLDNHLNVLAIVGMGGSGKTTLARNIYNHPVVKKHFKYQAWVTLTRELNTNDVFDLFKQTSTNITTGFGYGLSKLLGVRRKCLVVLDNVWDCESLHKDVLPNINKAIFFQETKIIITSRHYFAPLNKDLKWHFHKVQLLSSKDAQDLFNKVLFNGDDDSDRAEEYHGLASEMLNKCGGLPLAIVALAKLLKKKETIKDWETVFYQLMSKQGENDLYLPVNDILAVSYHNLPHYLKPCFLYFGLFPENSIIKAGLLLKMWIAEGFVQGQHNNGETSEDAARRLLQKLIDCTMVQVVNRNYCGKVKTLRVHDLMRGICIKESQELDFLSVFSSDSDHQGTIQNNSRRAVVNIRVCSTLPFKNSHLRTLFIQGQESLGKQDEKVNPHLSNELKLVCVKLKLLRVLDINGIKSQSGVMPKEIGNLIHLRYLRINSTNIRELPNSIGKLRKLITLDYWHVSEDNKGISLPNVLWKMRHLRHLYLPHEMSNINKNFKLETLKNLQTLWGVKGGDWMYKEMENLSSKLKKLCIQGISSPKLIDLVINYIVIKNDLLYSLALHWYDFELKEGLKKLCSNLSLKKLSLTGKVSDLKKPFEFPLNLEKLQLYYTQLQNPTSLVALENLKYLMFLKLEKDSFIGKEWIISGKDAFPKLEELKLINLPNLEKWEMDNGALVSLKKLSIVSCMKLERLPEGLKSITTLEKLNIELMPHNFNSKIRNAINLKGGEYFNIIKHIPDISIQDDLLH